MAYDTINRTALLALQAEPDAPHSGRRIVDGASVLVRQVDVALALGCSRIWLFAPTLDALAIKAQKLAEQGGAQFRLIQRGRQLLGGLRHQDELLVLAEGLLPAGREELDLIGEKGGILKLSADEGVQAGFERLDRDYCWAGAMLLPGRVLERLEGLEEDIDPLAALLRAGRANRVEETALPVEWVTGAQWSLMPAAAPQDSGMRDGVGRADTFSYVLTAAAGKWLARRPNLAIATAGLAAFSAILAILTLYLEYPATSLSLLVLTGALATCWVQADHYGDVRVFSGERNAGSTTPLIWITDVIGVTALSMGLQPSFDWYSTLYIAFLTWTTWALAGVLAGKLTPYFRDRMPLWLGAAFAGFAGQWFFGAAGLTAVALLAIVINLRNQSAITRA